MKTTIDIADALLAEAKALAAKRNTTLRALVEEGLRETIKRAKAEKPFKLRDASFHGDGLTEEFEAKGGWSKLREAAYPGFFDDEGSR